MPFQRAARRFALGGLAVLGACAACAHASAVPPGQARNLLLITIDTLRADHLGAYGYARATSPALDRLAATAVVFERAYATSSWTLPSLVSVLTALHPSSHDCREGTTPLAPSLETLAERLASAGFHTGAVTSHVYMARKYALDQGFADYDDELVKDTSEESHLAVTSPAISAKGVAWLEERAAEADPRRWFLWLHYFDPHSAYTLHPGVTEAFGTRAALDRYDGEIAFTDASIGSVLERLAELGFADDTVVVVAADHGEEFHDHGSVAHHRTLYEEVIRVPLLARAPGLAPGRCDEPVSLVDIAPTAYALLDVAAPATIQGQSLLPALAGRVFARAPVLAELGRGGRNASDAIVDGRWKVIRHHLDGELALFDLRADPGEQHDLADEEPARARELAAELARRVAEYRSLCDRPRGSVSLSPENLRALDNLGYGGDDEEERDEPVRE